MTKTDFKTDFKKVVDGSTVELSTEGAHYYRLGYNDCLENLLKAAKKSLKRLNNSFKNRREND